MMFLEFERPIEDIHIKMDELRAAKEQGVEHPAVKDVDGEIERLQLKEKTILRRLYRNLTPWQRVQVARHQARPQPADYVKLMIEDFTPLAGDRRFADDKTMLAGIGKFNGQSVAILGTQKGHKTAERVKFNFGMPKPEGYRKAERIMKMADKFNLPLITFVDTPGAFPGIDAEARGQSEAIASCIETLLNLNTPVVSVITGEGGSGGALAIAVADKVLMLENSTYSVISPEGCASILWRDAKEASEAAGAMKMTADELLKLNVVDEIIKEPVGGAHRDEDLTIKRVSKSITDHLKDLKGDKKSRRQRFLALDGVY
ncbi:MAG: acetyl-CoA carboxylase carboxyltransferase subunit alpha [Pseudomonadota bacterium]|nr:acetyl-CoA carboxylase carboxyltransferase subunit alpha [Pseudomonadota bacterium]